MKLFIILIFSTFSNLVFGQKNNSSNNYLKEINNPIWETPNWYYGYCSHDEIYIYDSIVVVKSGMCEGRDEGEMYGLNDKTGKIIWKLNLAVQGDVYQFHLDNIYYILGEKLICTNIYTGKERWSFEKDEKNLYGNKIYFVDNIIYILSKNNIPSETVNSNNNNSASNIDLILINETTGKQINEFNNISQTDAWIINYVNKNTIVLFGYDAISAYNMDTRHEDWCLKKTPSIKSHLYDPKSEFKDTIIDYSFIQGIGDTIFLGRKTSSINYNNGEEKILALNIDNGNIISEFFTSKTNEYLSEYHYVPNIIHDQNLIFINRTFLTKDFSRNAPAEYKLVCIDLTSFKVKWERKISEGDFDGNRFLYVNFQVDSSAVYLHYTGHNLSCFSLDNGNILWEKKFSKQMSNFTIFGNYIICDIIKNSSNNINHVEILNKFTSNTISSNKKTYKYLKTNINNDVYFLNSRNKIFKLKSNTTP